MFYAMWKLLEKQRYLSNLLQESPEREFAYFLTWRAS